MKFNITALLGCTILLFTQLGFSQPNVEWQRSYWAPKYPTSLHQPNTPIGPNGFPLLIDQDQNLSSEDWFYFHAISKGTDNKPNGYICTGYSEFLNYVESDKSGCLQFKPLNTKIGYDIFEAVNYRKGNMKQVISLIDLNGNTKWYKTFSNGDMSNVVQTSDGGYVAIGAGASTEDGHDTLVAYNPGQTSGHVTDYFIHGQADVGVIDVPRKIRIVKVDRNGTKLWEYMYGMEPYVGNGNVAFALTSKTTGGSAGGGIIETSEGDIMFTAKAQDPAYGKMGRTCVIRITSTGIWKWGRFYGSTIPTQNSIGSAIAKTGIGSGQNFYISGTEADPINVQHAYLFKIDNTNSPSPIWIKYHERTLGNADGGSAAGSTISFNSAGELILPVVHNIIPAGAYRGYKAEAIVYRIDPSSGNDISSTSFGSICAFDLTVGATATADGGFAVVSSTNRNYVAPPAQNNKYFFPDHSTTTDPLTMGNYDPVLYIEYGFNDGYVAKCDEYGNKEWEKIFDSNTHRQDQIYPYPTPNNWSYPDPNHSDVRRTECLYSIVQSPDGGFVVAGNNSENFDDSYVVKLSSTCTDNTLSNLTINTSPLVSYLYTATNYIYASTVVIPAGPADVNFKAGNAIVISPGFRADYGSKFIAEIDLSLDCTPNSYRAGIANGKPLPNKISKETDKNALNVFPNPNNGIFTIRANDEGLKSVYVYDVRGTLIFEKTSFTDKQFEVDITMHPKGLYFVKVLENGVMKTAKIINQ
ncbi:MAG: T9SS type A sorting domain-containing protein [Bacteroidia bacterium]